MHRQGDEHEALDPRFRHRLAEELRIGASRAGDVALAVQLAVFLGAVLGEEAVQVPVDEGAHERRVP